VGRTYPQNREEDRVVGRKLAVAGMALAAVAITAGCSSNSSSADSTPTSAAGWHGAQLSQRVAAALDNATSAHLHGTLSNLQGSTGLTGTLDALANHSSESGTVSTHGSGALKMVITGAKVYLNGDAGFWKSSASSDDQDSAQQGAALASALANRWVFVPADNSTPTSAEGYTLADLATTFRNDGSGSGTVLDTVTAANLNGHQVYVISKKDGSKLYVDQTTLLPVRMVNSAASTGGAVSIDFDRYNAKVSIVAPSGAVSMNSVLGINPS
jgi:hypothetical protein